MTSTATRLGSVFVAVGLLAACGTPNANGEPHPAAVTSRLDAPIDVLADTELARGLDSSIALTERPFEVDPAVAQAGSEAVSDVWLASGVPIDEQTVASLADALSITDHVERGEGGWFAGSSDPAATMFSVSLSNGGWFQMRRGPQTVAPVEAGPCPTQPFTETDGGLCVAGWEPQPTIASTPPLSDAVIEQATLPVIGALGVDVADLAVRTAGSQASVTQVHVVFQPDGVPSDLQWEFELGPAGEVRSVYGPTGPVSRCCTVSTVSVDEVLTRLARQMAPLPVPVEPGATEPEVFDPMPVAPQPVAMITAVLPALTSVWDVDGTRWLVPAFLFTGDSISTSVVAIDAGLIRSIDPLTIPPPPAWPTTMPIVTTPLTAPSPQPTATAVPMPTTSTPG